MSYHRIKIITIVILIIILGLFLFKFSNKSTTTFFEINSEDKMVSQKEIPVTLSWNKYIVGTTGISFTYPDVWKVVKNNADIYEIGAITLKIEHLSCSDHKPSKPLFEPIKIYGYETQINEAQQTAYICNNSKTACIDIFSNNKKMSEEFYHGFISTLNLTKDFDKIDCYK